MLKNQNSIELNSFNSRYDEVFIRANKDAVVLAGTLVSFSDEGYDYQFPLNRQAVYDAGTTATLPNNTKDYSYGTAGTYQKKYNEGIATTEYDVPKEEITDNLEVLYKGTMYEQVKHNITKTIVEEHYTASYDIAQFYPAVILENSLIANSINHQNFANLHARCRRLVAGDKFLLRAVAGSYNYGDPLYAVQTSNGIYVTTEKSGMFIGWCEETYNITEDMVDLVDTYEFPETKGSLRGKLVNLIAVRIGKAYEVKADPKITGLNISQTTTSIIYDGNEHPVTDFVTLTGTESSDTVTYTVDKLLTGGDIPSIQSAGKYKITVRVQREGYHDYVSSPFTVTIEKRQLSVSGSSVADKDYDGTTAATVLIGAVSNFAAGESFEVIASGVFDGVEIGERSVTVTYSIPQAYKNDYLAPKTEILTANINAIVLPEITGLTITPLSNIKYNGEDQNVASLIAGNYAVGDKVTYSPNTIKNAGTYNISVTVEREGYQTYTTSVQLVVGKAEIVVSNVTVKDKEYDGTVDAEIDSYDVTGIYDGFELDVTAAFDSSGPGDKAVSVNFAIPSAYLSNYSLAVSQFNVTANITPAPTGDEDLEGVTLNAPATVIYNGTQNVADIVSLMGIEEGDVIIYSPSTVKNVGEYEVIVTVEREGYNLWTSEPQTITITPSIVSVFGSVAQGKTYDKTTAATITLGTVTGLVSGDDATLGYSAEFASAVPGVQDVSVTYSLGGADIGNYILDTVNETLSAEITTKPFSITGTEIKEKVYDGTSAAEVVVGSVTGLIEGDDVTITGSAIFHTVTVGNYNITVHYTLTGADADKYYAAPQTRPTKIKPKRLTISGTTVANKTYDGTTDATITAGTLDGLVGSDTVELAASGSFPSAEVGVYDVEVSYSISGGAYRNYYAPITETISAEIIAASVPTLDNVELQVSSPSYNGGDQSVSQFVNAVIDGEEAGEGDTITCSPSTVKNAGTYSVEVTVEREGYQPYTETVELTVLKSQILVSGTTVDDKTYDGTTTAQINVGTVSGIQSPDSFDVIASGSFPSANVGSYGVRVTYSIPEDYLGNYTVPDAENVYAEILNAVLTGIQASANNITVGDPLSISVTGTQEGDEVKYVYKGVEYLNVTSIPISTAGSYTVQVSVRRENYSTWTGSVTFIVSSPDAPPTVSYHYVPIADGGENSATTRGINLRLMPDNNTVTIPEQIPVSSITVGGDAVINTNAEYLDVVNATAYLPVQMIKKASGDYFIDIKIDLDNSDTEVKTIPAYFMTGYYGCYPCQLGGLDAPTEEQIHGMEGKNVFVGPKEDNVNNGVVECRFGINMADWDKEVAANGITGDDADITENEEGGGKVFFITCWDGTDVTSIMSGPIEQLPAFKPWTITLDGIQYSGVISRQTQYVTGSSVFEVHLS